MKIRFDSPKEARPTEDGGLRVIYAPGKRMAFRLRWYLLMLLVASPLLWLGGSWLLGVERIEAPARIYVPTLQVRAFDAGQVREVMVTPGQPVQAGELLLRLDNPEWRERLALLAESGDAPGADAGQLPARERRVLQAALAAAERRLAEARRLFAMGAATRGEVLEAEAEGTARQQQLLQFEQRQIQPEPADQRQRRLEREWLEQRLAGLEVRAPEAGRVVGVEVVPGERVAPGLPLLSLEREHQVQMWVYLPARHAAYAHPGQPLTLLLPDGSRRAAMVTRQVYDTAQVPEELLPPFSSTARTLLVLVTPRDPLPPMWRINNLGLQVRFERDWGRTLGLVR